MQGPSARTGASEPSGVGRQDGFLRLGKAGLGFQGRIPRVVGEKGRSGRHSPLDRIQLPRRAGAV